jgi:hypothetical protein
MATIFTELEWPNPVAVTYRLFRQPVRTQKWTVAPVKAWETKLIHVAKTRIFRNVFNISE